MSAKNGLTLRIILGVYLAYQGIKLLGIPAQERPDNFILFAICGIVFIVIGAVFAVNAVKNYIRLTKESEIHMVTYEQLKKEEADKEEGGDDSCE